MSKSDTLISLEQIERAILLFRGQKVMLDRDLPALYGVETKNLNKAVKRNAKRFPADFMFQLTSRANFEFWILDWKAWYFTPHERQVCGKSTCRLRFCPCELCLFLSEHRIRLCRSAT